MSEVYTGSWRFGSKLAWHATVQNKSKFLSRLKGREMNSKSHWKGYGYRMGKDLRPLYIRVNECNFAKITKPWILTSGNKNDSWGAMKKTIGLSVRKNNDLVLGKYENENLEWMKN